MTTSRRQRYDPRRDATRGALVEAAESMFAELGVEATSTRQLATAIGALNTNVVAYHFGSKDALVEAVFHRRLPDLDRRRGELLASLEAQAEPPTVLNLLMAFALPLFEQVDSAGKHSFARFLGGLERSGMAAVRGLVVKDYPHSQRLTGHLVACLPPNMRGQAHLRIRLVLSMLTAVMQVIDHAPGITADEARTLFDNAVAMSAAAFAAPAAKAAS